MSVAAPFAQTAEARPRRSGLRLLVVFGLLLALVWAAPVIASFTPLVAWATDKAGMYIDGSVQVGSVSLGWFSPVVLTNVEIRDAGGQAIVQIPRIQSERSLLRLLWNRDDLGSFRIEKAKIEWAFQGDGSNLERLFGKALQEPTNTPGADASHDVPQIELHIVDATILIRDDDTKQTWQILALSLKAENLNDEARSVRLSLQANLNDGQEPGSLKADAHLKNLQGGAPSAIVKGRFTSFPLDLANVIVRRFQPATKVAGSLQGQANINASFKDGKPLIEFVGETIGNRVAISSPLLAEPFFTDRVKVPFAVLLDDQKVTAQRIEMQSDFGNVALQGAFNLNTDWQAALEQPNFELEMEVNLATLAERLPKTFHLHNDLRLTAGQLKVQCKSQAKDGQVVWTGGLQSSDVRGIRGAQTIQWTDPIALEFQVRELNKGVPIVDRLICNAKFLHIDGSSTEDRFTLRADADLRQLAEPLGQFIDLGAMKLAGKASALIVVRRGDKEQFLVQGNVQVKQMNLSWLTREPVQEEAVAVTFNARGQIDKAGRQRIDAGTLDVRLESDSIVLKIADPVADLAAGPWGSLSARLDGDLSRWHRRLRCWTNTLDDWKLAGQATVQAQVRPTAQAVEWTNTIVQARDLQCLGSDLWIREPTFNIQTAGRWDAKTGAIDLTQTTLTCLTVQIEANRLSLQPASMNLLGSASVKGDVARLRQWTQDPNAKPGEPMAGTFVAKFNGQAVGQRIVAEFDGAIKNLTYGPTAQPTWREPEAKITGRATYDLAKDTLQIEQASVTSATLAADAKGTIARWSTAKDIDLTGTLAYDLEKLEPHLRPLLGKDVKVAGKDRRAFKVAGPLYPPAKTPVVAVSASGPSLSQPPLSYRELKGEASTHWTSLKALGCAVGSAEVKAIVQQGWIQVYPIETTLNGGKLRLQPNIRLEAGPMELVLLAGPVIDKAKITPEMCAGAIGYAMPVLANVTAAEGSISVTLEGARVPLSTPTTGEVKGTLVLHSARVGPNAIVRELTSLLKMAPPTGTVKDCSVPFHMVNGKVHHSNLEIAFNDFTIRSSGAVGLDGSLALVIEMPIPPRLATAAKLTPAQAKQLLRIPVGGTLEQPRLDGRALESLTSILGRSFLENELNKLLQPKR